MILTTPTAPCAWRVPRTGWHDQHPNSERISKSPLWHLAELCTVLEAVPYTAALLNECGWRWYADANGHDRSRMQGGGNGRLWHDAQSDEFTRCRLTATGGYHWCHPAHTWGRAVELDCQVSDWLGWDRSYFSKGTVPPGVVVRKAA